MSDPDRNKHIIWAGLVAASETGPEKKFRGEPTVQAGATAHRFLVRDLGKAGSAPVTICNEPVSVLREEVTDGDEKFVRYTVRCHGSMLCRSNPANHGGLNFHSACEALRVEAIVFEVPFFEDKEPATHEAKGIRVRYVELGESRWIHGGYDPHGHVTLYFSNEKGGRDSLCPLTHYRNFLGHGPMTIHLSSMDIEVTVTENPDGTKETHSRQPVIISIVPLTPGAKILDKLPDNRNTQEPQEYQILRFAYDGQIESVSKIQYAEAKSLDEEQ